MKNKSKLLYQGCLSTLIYRAIAFLFSFGNKLSLVLDASWSSLIG